MKRIKLAVLISGSGSNLQAIIDACGQEDYPAEICCVISNKADAYGLERAKAATIPHVTIRHNDFADRESFDQAMDAIIREHEAELVCLAGFMRLITPWFIDKWHNKLVNIHPSLLPSFKGLHAQEQALNSGVTIAGCTVHFVRQEMDSGPIIIQAAVPVLTRDTTDSLTMRILTQEHLIYPAAIRMIAEGELTINGDTLVWNKTTPSLASIINPAI